MVQNAIVKKTMGDGVVQVSLLRQMECGLHCTGACEGCAQKPKEEILALASNSIGAQPGDLVEVEPADLGEGMSLLTAALGLVLGFVPAVLANRAITRSKGPEFHILKFLR